jgi:hypothetical protein
VRTNELKSASFSGTVLPTVVTLLQFRFLDVRGTVIASSPRRR